MEKIREWLLIKISTFRKPLTNYQITQNALLKNRLFEKYANFRLFTSWGNLGFSTNFYVATTDKWPGKWRMSMWTQPAKCSSRISRPTSPDCSNFRFLLLFYASDCRCVPLSQSDARFRHKIGFTWCWRCGQTSNACKPAKFIFNRNNGKTHTGGVARHFFFYR